MKCPICKEKTRVVDLSHNLDANETYRLIKCPKCGKEFYTSEFIIEDNKDFKWKWVTWHRSYNKGE